jgi:hypothetical protein
MSIGWNNTKRNIRLFYRSWLKKFKTLHSSNQLLDKLTLFLTCERNFIFIFETSYKYKRSWYNISSWRFYKPKKKIDRKRIPHISAPLQYRVLSRDSFESLIFSIQLLLAVALDKRPAWRRVPPFNHLNSTYTLTNHKGPCMSPVISMPCPGDPRQTAVSDLSKVILYLLASRFEHSSLVVCARQHNQSTIAALI